MDDKSSQWTPQELMEKLSQGSSVAVLKRLLGVERLEREVEELKRRLENAGMGR